ncbi:hypothetical protein [Bifidobacterium callitrichos]|uniref:hypothetical protein n=1 Tax=Bifidobacterium callitrichos TaxID=762209 RepID=UPI00126A6C93|nr:hypothetical protein [Bifidobacterium callitrichos]
MGVGLADIGPADIGPNVWVSGLLPAGSTADDMTDGNTADDRIRRSTAKPIAHLLRPSRLVYHNCKGIDGDSGVRRKVSMKKDFPPKDDGD